MKKINTTYFAMMSSLYFISVSASAEPDYGTSVRRGGSVGSYSSVDYGTSVRRTRTSSSAQTPAIPAAPSFSPSRSLVDLNGDLPSDYVIDVPSVQLIQSDDLEEDVSYGTSVRPGARSTRNNGPKQIVTYTRYTVKHVAHTSSGGYHVFFISANPNGYHLYYVGPGHPNTYMGWRNSR